MRAALLAEIVKYRQKVMVPGRLWDKFCYRLFGTELPAANQLEQYLNTLKPESDSLSESELEPEAASDHLPDNEDLYASHDDDIVKFISNIASFGEIVNRSFRDAIYRTVFQYYKEIETRYNDLQYHEALYGGGLSNYNMFKNAVLAHFYAARSRGVELTAF